MEESKFLIITGMSGAGKTQVVRTLEDMNFFCIDNLPPALIPKFAELCRRTLPSLHCGRACRPWHSI